MPKLPLLNNQSPLYLGKCVVFDRTLARISKYHPVAPAFVTTS